MIHKPLGNSSLLVSKIGLGLSQLNENRNKKKYGYISEKEIQKILRYAISNNINFFDTADNYGNTERLLGKLPKHLKNQSVISTKVGYKRDGTGIRIFKRKYIF